MLEFLERQRPVIERAGQTESVRDQHLFARAVAVIHAVQLRNGLMALVDEHDRIVRQVIEQRGRRFAGQPSGKMPRIILDAVAVADLFHHFEIEHGALVQPLRLDQLALRFELRTPRFELGLDRLDGRFFGQLRHHVVRLGIDRQPLVGLLHLAEQRIDLRQRLHFIAPHFDAVGALVVGGKDLDHVAAHAKRAAAEIVVVAVVEDLDQLGGDLLARDCWPFSSISSMP